MPLLIDTYNVLHTVGILPPDLAGIDAQGLIELLVESRYRHEKTTLVCDGVPTPPARPGGAAGAGAGDRPNDRRASQFSIITIRYSGHGRPADDLIGQLVQASSAPRRLIVVSSDHAVQRAAKKRRCPTLTSQEFLQQLVYDARGLESGGAAAVAKPLPGDMTDDQVDRWVKVFNLDQETIEIPTGYVPPTKHELRTPKAVAGSDAAKSDVSVNPLNDAAADLELPHPVGGELPPDLIAQAEMLWAQENPPPPKLPNHENSAQDSDPNDIE